MYPKSLAIQIDIESVISKVGSKTNALDFIQLMAQKMGDAIRRVIDRDVNNFPIKVTLENVEVTIFKQNWPPILITIFATFEEQNHLSHEICRPYLIAVNDELNHLLEDEGLEGLAFEIYVQPIVDLDSIWNLR
jgi:hypothetical protein